MSMELLQRIEQAETQAEGIRAQAQREARDILKGVEETIVTSERSAVLEHRAMAQHVLEEAERTAHKRIGQAAAAEAEQRAETVAAARQRLQAAANLIYERVVNDGHR